MALRYEKHLNVLKGAPRDLRSLSSLTDITQIATSLLLFTLQDRMQLIISSYTTEIGIVSNAWAWWANCQSRFMSINPRHGMMRRRVSRTHLLSPALQLAVDKECRQGEGHKPSHDQQHQHNQELAPNSLR
jgi:hypothetical protein